MNTFTESRNGISDIVGRVNSLSLDIFVIPQPETARVLWSWHSEDPLGPDRIREHEFKGSTSLNLLTGGTKKREDPPNAQVYTIAVENVRSGRN